MKHPHVGSHWHKLFANFSTSTLDFYGLVEQALGRKEIPDLRTSRVTWKEEGLFSQEREYLRVSRGPLSFDICAAPFGTGFFFSWWLIVMPPLFEMVLCLVVLFLLWLGMEWLFVQFMGYVRGILVGLLFYLALLFNLGIAVRGGLIAAEEIVLFLPVLGSLYERLFLPPTFYRMDTRTMFQEAVSAAVQEAIEAVTKPHGIRELSEAERRPAVGSWEAAGVGRG